jgi:hypothetical protein
MEDHEEIPMISRLEACDVESMGRFIQECGVVARPAANAMQV